MRMPRSATFEPASRCLFFRHIRSQDNDCPSRNGQAVLLLRASNVYCKATFNLHEKLAGGVMESNPIPIGK